MNPILEGYVQLFRAGDNQRGPMIAPCYRPGPDMRNKYFKVPKFCGKRVRRCPEDQDISLTLLPITSAIPCDATLQPFTLADSGSQTSDNLALSTISQWISELQTTTTQYPTTPTYSYVPLAVKWEEILRSAAAKAAATSASSTVDYWSESKSELQTATTQYPTTPTYAHVPTKANWKGIWLDGVITTGVTSASSASDLSAEFVSVEHSKPTLVAKTSALASKVTGGTLHGWPIDVPFGAEVRALRFDLHAINSSDTSSDSRAVRSGLRSLAKETVLAEPSSADDPSDTSEARSKENTQNFVVLRDGSEDVDVSARSRRSSRSASSHLRSRSSVVHTSNFKRVDLSQTKGHPTSKTQSLSRNPSEMASRADFSSKPRSSGVEIINTTVASIFPPASNLSVTNGTSLTPGFMNETSKLGTLSSTAGNTDRILEHPISSENVADATKMEPAPRATAPSVPVDINSSLSSDQNDIREETLPMVSDNLDLAVQAEAIVSSGTVETSPNLFGTGRPSNPVIYSGYTELISERTKPAGVLADSAKIESAPRATASIAPLDIISPPSSDQNGLREEMLSKVRDYLHLTANHETLSSSGAVETSPTSLGAGQPINPVIYLGYTDRTLEHPVSAKVLGDALNTESTPQATASVAPLDTVPSQSSDQNDLRDGTTPRVYDYLYQIANTETLVSSKAVETSPTSLGAGQPIDTIIYKGSAKKPMLSTVTALIWMLFAALWMG